MTKKALKAATEAYKEKAARQTKDEMLQLIIADEYEEADAQEIVNELYTFESDKEESPVKTEEKKPVYFEEWKVEKKFEAVGDDGERVKVSFERLKQVRPKVNITQETADILNVGMLAPSSVNPILYLLPNEDLKRFTYTYKKKS